jgi:hypothetical protein
MLPRNAVGCEVGVWQGGFSQSLLTKTKPSKLYLVDPWLWDLPTSIPKECYIANRRVAKNQADMDSIYEAVVARFKDHEEVIILRQPSVEAANNFPDDMFDWVYIDGAHDYDNVLADLRSWSKKVKPGGFMCGDDYDWGKKYKLPVKRAVEDFLKESGFEKVRIQTGQFVLRRAK